MIRNTILFILFVLLISSCKKETCFNCQSYDAKTFDGNLDNSAGLSELKYYIVELMKDQNEIRQIVKDLRELLEKGEEN